ncbi:MAG: hypothetical protein CMJ46_12500 [Planctomyces sp.]|nr:hypothetical protein [Planctomyces sp.]
MRRNVAAVTLGQTTETYAAFDLTCDASGFITTFDQLIVESLMIPFFMVGRGSFERGVQFQRHLHR